MEEEKQKLVSQFKYGTREERVVALTLMRRKMNKNFLTEGFDFSEVYLKELSRKIQELGPLTEEEVETYKDTLIEATHKPHDLLIMFYLCITLIDLGYTNCDFAKLFLDVSEKLMTEVSNLESLAGAFLEFSIQEETVKSLCKFKSCPDVPEIIEKCFEGQILVGRMKEGGIQNLRKLSIFAFGVIGDDRYKPLVEYWATHPIRNKEEDEIVSTAIQALKSWGSDRAMVVLNAIKSKEGDDVVCIAEEYANEWLCICGRKNEKRRISCQNCGRNRDYVLGKYTLEKFKL
jgi:hypothetical protein